jgi:hypothetical protein
LKTEGAESAEPDLPKGNFGLVEDDNIRQDSTTVPERQVNYIEWFNLGVERSFGAANGNRRIAQLNSGALAFLATGLQDSLQLIVDLKIF